MIFGANAALADESVADPSIVTIDRFIKDQDAVHAEDTYMTPCLNALLTRYSIAADNETPEQKQIREARLEIVKDLLLAKSKKFAELLGMIAKIDENPGGAQIRLLKAINAYVAIQAKQALTQIDK